MAPLSLEEDFILTVRVYVGGNSVVSGAYIPPGIKVAE